MRPPARIFTLPAVILGAMLLPLSLAGQDAPHGFRSEFESQFGSSARKLVALAEAMPADSYDWTPMEGVATVAEVFMHIARYNYYYPDASMGLDSPVPASEYDSWEGGVNDKDEVVAILAESMDHVRQVVDGMSDADLDTPTRLYGRDVANWAVLLQLVTHMNEHLGQSIAYARMNGVVPPWSR
jgi:uncharacterized damage-inducible protein DinB